MDARIFLRSRGPRVAKRAAWADIGIGTISPLSLRRKDLINRLISPLLPAINSPTLCALITIHNSPSDMKRIIVCCDGIPDRWKLLTPQEHGK